MDHGLSSEKPENRISTRRYMWYAVPSEERKIRTQYSYRKAKGTLGNFLLLSWLMAIDRYRFAFIK